MNTYLKYQSAAVQLFTFLMLAGGFFILDFAISNFFFSDINAVFLSNKEVISDALIAKSKLAQLVTSTMLFIVPALLFAYYSSPKPLPYIGLHKNLSLVLLLSVCTVYFTIQPFVGWLGQLNEKINFGSLQKILMEKEEMYNKILETFLQMKTSGDLFINLCVMALLPAIGEELFFRGALQKVLLRISGKPWLAIFVSSTIFALLHLTIFKIMPIFTLGLLLGTVYYLTKNLWYTIILHFLNNALAVLAFYFADKNAFFKKLANDDFNVPVYAAFISLAVVVIILFFIKNNSGNQIEEDNETEDTNFAEDTNLIA